MKLILFFVVLQISFIDPITKENCYKIGRDLLANITTKFTELISSLLIEIRDNFRQVEKLAPYLFQGLPLNQWRPPMQAFEIASAWLLNFCYESAESTLARVLFSRLNWNFDKRTEELFLSHEIHVRMACLIVEVSLKHAPETVGLLGFTESVRQMSNIMKRENLSPQQQFITWCWNMVGVLRLHCFDQNSQVIYRAIREPQNALRHVLEVERLLAVSQGVVDNRPLAVYLSILMTLWGHSVPQICQKGFAQLQILMNDYRHSAVIRCLQLVTPFFLDCPESLRGCQSFQAIVSALYNADRTYLRMTKSFMSSDGHGPVVEMFGNMIQAQIIDYCQFGFDQPGPFINLWLQALTASPLWYKEPNALHIVNIIVRIAYQFGHSWNLTKEFFRDMCKATNESKPAQSTSFIPFLGGASNSPSNSFLSTPSAAHPWLSLLTLDIEHELYEIDTRLWPELLRQMQKSSLKFNMENLIKATAKIVGTQACPAQSLVIYKIANLILTCAYDESALPILCQKFFNLYLARVPLSADEQRFADIHGVADKFYECNISLMKKLKRFFVDGMKFERELAEKSEENIEKELHSARSK